MGAKAAITGTLDVSVVGSDGSSIIPNADGSINVTSTGVGGAVSIPDGADVAEGAKADAAYAGSGNATVISALKAIANSALSNTPATVQGGTASAGAVTFSPVTLGGRAATALPTAVADGQVVNDMRDKYGRSIVRNALRELMGDATITLTSTVTETTLIAAVASTFNDVYGVIIENISATVCEVSFRDTTAGTIRFNIEVPANDTRGFMLPPGGGFNQATVNTNWTAQCGTSVASIKITVLYTKNA
jgi:predicted membrane protein